MRVRAEEVVDASAAEVFQFVAAEHFANHPRWDPAISEMTPTSPGPVREGSTARFVRTDGKRRSAGVLRVTEYEPDRVFAAISRFGPFELHQRLLCEPLPSRGTQLVLVIDTRATGAMRLLLPLLGAQFRRTMAASLHTIKQHVESGSSH